MQKEKLKIVIGDKFYRWIDVRGVFEYIVKGIRKYENDEQYELECQQCGHGDKCLLLCAIDDYQRLQYIKLLNDDEDNSQSHWHVFSGQFYQTKQAAIISKTDRTIAYFNEKIAKAESDLKLMHQRKNDELAAYQALINSIVELA